MGTASVRELRSRLSEIVDAVERGESVTITRRGRRVAVIGPVRGKGRGKLPDLSAFRASLGGRVKGKGLSQTVIASRAGERG